MKISKRLADLLSNALVSISMTLVMSFGLLFLKSGIDADYFEKGFRGFLTGCCLSIPTGFIVVPLVNRLFESITEK